MDPVTAEWLDPRERQRGMKVGVLMTEIKISDSHLVWSREENDGQTPVIPHVPRGAQASVLYVSRNLPDREGTAGLHWQMSDNGHSCVLSGCRRGIVLNLVGQIH